MLGERNLINLAAAEGNAIEIMDLGLALQSLSLEELRNGNHMNGVFRVPESIEMNVAKAALAAWVQQPFKNTAI